MSRMVQVSSTSPPKKSAVWRFLIVAVLLAVFCLWKEPPLVSTLTAAHVTTKKSKSKSSIRIITPVKEVIQGVDVLWVSASDDNKKPCGILFVGHGCSHSHTDWFSTCDDDDDVECLGLPEEKAIVKIALDLQLLVVAVSSQNRESKCWNIQTDGPRVATVLQEISNRFVSPSNNLNSNSIPLFAFGASSGGSFVSQLQGSMSAQGLKLDGFVSQIMATPPRTTTHVDSSVYITMNRDVRTDERAKAIVMKASSSSHGTTTTQAKHIRLPPLALGESFFSDRIEEVSLAESQAMVQSLQREGFLDTTTTTTTTTTQEGLLLHDPRKSDWRTVIRPYAPVGDSLVADRSPISEVFNVAYGMHEMTRDGVKEALTFCLAAGKQTATAPECRSV